MEIWLSLLQIFLLLFIYAEVFGLVAVYFRSHELPVIYPLFIAITALSRLIVLQGKDSANL